GGVALAAAPEGVVVADHELPHPQSTDQDRLDELTRAELPEVAIEAQEDGVVDTGGGQHLDLLVTRGEEWGGGLGADDAEGVRIEDDDHCAAIGLDPAAGDLSEDRLVTAV